MMGRTPSREDESGLKKGPWTPEEDRILVDYIKEHGHASWRALPKLAGLNRCGKSCRLRWTNYLRPDIKRGKFSEEEEQLIINLHALLGNKWSAIAGHLPGRTDNEIKNFWNTHLRKKLLQMGLDPVTHRPRSDYHLDLLSYLQQLLAAANILSGLTNTNWDINTLSLNSDNNNNNATQQLANLQMLQNIIIQVLGSNPAPNTESLINPFGQIPSLPNGLYEALGSLNQSKLQNLFNNGSTGFPSNFQNFEALLQPGQFPTISCMKSQESDEQLDATNSPTTPFNQLPNLVSASPDECSNVKQMESNNVSPNECPNPCSSSTSTTFEMWADFMCEEATDAYWKDIIDHDCNQP